MPGANGSKHLLSGNGATGVRLHSIADTDNFLPEPLLDCGVTLLQRTQSGAHYLAARSISTRSNKCIDVTGLLGGQAESSLLR